VSSSGFQGNLKFQLTLLFQNLFSISTLYCFSSFSIFQLFE